MRSRAQGVSWESDCGAKQIGLAGPTYSPGSAHRADTNSRQGTSRLGETYAELARGHAPRGHAVKASVTIHVETLWTNRAELMIEAELDNPHSETNQQVVSMMFEAAR